jgi:hypothetical protein
MTMADDATFQTAVQNQVGLIEQQVEQLSKLAVTRLPTELACKGLRDLCAAVHLPNFGDQSKNNAWNGQPESPKVDTADPLPNAPPNVTHPKMAHLEENSAIAESIIQKVDETNLTIDGLVAAGKKFNASKAKGDLLALVTKTASILAQVDLAEPWVKEELQQLDGQATTIHGLFAPTQG